MENLKEKVKEVIKEKVEIKVEKITVEYSDYYNLLYIRGYRGYKNNEEYLVTIWLHDLIPEFEKLEEKEQEKIKVEIINIIDNFLEQNGYTFSLNTYSYIKTSP